MFYSIQKEIYSLDDQQMEDIEKIKNLASAHLNGSWDFETEKACWMIKGNDRIVINPICQSSQLERINHSSFSLGTSDLIFLYLNQMKRKVGKPPKESVFVPSFSKNADHCAFYLNRAHQENCYRSLMYIHSFNNISDEDKYILLNFADDIEIGQTHHSRLGLISIVKEENMKNNLMYFTKTLGNTKFLYSQVKDDRPYENTLKILFSASI